MAASRSRPWGRAPGPDDGARKRPAASTMLKPMLAPIGRVREGRKARAQPDPDAWTAVRPRRVPIGGADEPNRDATRPNRSRPGGVIPVALLGAVLVGFGPSHARAQVSAGAEEPALASAGASSEGETARQRARTRPGGRREVRPYLAGSAPPSTVSPGLSLPPGPRKLTPWPWFPLGAGGRSLASGAGLELLGPRAEENPWADGSGNQQARGRMKDRQATARVLAGVGGALVVGGGVMIVIGKAPDRESPPLSAVFTCNLTACGGGLGRRF